LFKVPLLRNGKTRLKPRPLSFPHWKYQPDVGSQSGHLVKPYIALGKGLLAWSWGVTGGLTGRMLAHQPAFFRLGLLEGSQHSPWLQCCNPRIQAGSGWGGCRGEQLSGKAAAAATSCNSWPTCQSPPVATLGPTASLLPCQWWVTGFCISPLSTGDLPDEAYVQTHGGGAPGEPSLTPEDGVSWHPRANLSHLSPPAAPPGRPSPLADRPRQHSA
jgi:hypothetical protein